ncbi:MAG: GNAT family N-acetyltransferase [Oscillospiraceae bacterium]|jgi:probable phosphoglycerate mutase|nr:GNAT family N-acetyltransferase [Oscillospiraceae bacterium]
MVERVYLIRHAEAEGNIYRRVHGTYDSLLTENGILQVEALRERMKGESVGRVFSSDLMRAVKTAGAVRTRSKIIEIPAFREMYMGAYEDSTWGELLRRDRGIAGRYAADMDYRIEGGESMRDVYNRVSPSLGGITKGGAEAVAIVSHSFALRAVMCALWGKPAEGINDSPMVGNASVSLFVRDGGGYRDEYINDVGHLKGLENFKAGCPEEYGIENPQLWFRSAENAADIEAATLYWENTWFLVNGRSSGFDRLAAESEIRRILRGDKDSVRFAMLEDMEIGILIMDSKNLYEDDCGHISLFAVKEGFRGCGLSVQMVGEAISFYRNRGRSRLRLRVSAANERAIKFYKRNGFKEASLEYDSDGEQYIMKKSIGRG